MGIRDKEVIIGAIIVGIIVLSSIAIVVLLLISDDPFGEKIERLIVLDKSNIVEEMISGQEIEVSIEAVTKNIEDDLKWSSSDEKIATVRAEGKTAVITLKAEGVATISVKAGNVKAECQVVVKEVESMITLIPKEVVEEIVKGSTKVITLISTVENLDENVTWEVDNEKVATLVPNGKIAELTLKEAGNAIVTAKVGDKIAKCNVIVLEKESMIALNTTNIYKEIAKDSSEEQVLEATLVNVKEKLNWSTSDEKVAKIEDIDGKTAKLTLVGAGNAVITVTDGNVKATCNVKVTYPQPSVIIKYNDKSVVNQTITVEAKQGETKTLSLIPELKNTTGDVTWKSSNDNVAIVIKSGTTARVVLKDFGTTTITATVNGKTATCNIKVVEKKK